MKRKWQISRLKRHCIWIWRQKRNPPALVWLDLGCRGQIQLQISFKISLSLEAPDTIASWGRYAVGVPVVYKRCWRPRNCQCHIQNWFPCEPDILIVNAHFRILMWDNILCEINPSSSSSKNNNSSNKNTTQPTLKKFQSYSRHMTQGRQWPINGLHCSRKNMNNCHM